MTTATPGATYTAPTSATEVRTTGWTGWIAFAGIVMIIGGVFAAFQGLVAIANSNWAVWANVDNLATSVKNWGWIHLVIGVVVVLTGAGVMTGNVLARAIGVVAVGISLIANFLFLPAYPLWGLTIMALDLLVMWALIVHGGEMRSADLR